MSTPLTTNQNAALVADEDEECEPEGTLSKGQAKHLLKLLERLSPELAPLLTDLLDRGLDEDNLAAMDEDCEAREEDEDEEDEDALSARGQDDEDEDEEEEDDERPLSTLNSQRGSTGANASQNSRLDDEDDEDESNSSSDTGACSPNELLDEAGLSDEDVPIDLDELGSELSDEACEDFEELIDTLVVKIRPEMPIIYRGREGFR